MEKAKHSQFDLFSKTDGGGPLKNSVTNLFSNYIHNYEKIILAIIVFLITGVIAFSLGMEKGKRAASIKYGSHIETADKTHPDNLNQAAVKKEQIPAKTQSNSEKQIFIQNKPLAAQTNNIIKQDMSAYTIQVGSYHDKKIAKQEADRLKNKGFAALTLSKAGYVVVCVGNFSSKETAKSLLSQLKKSYQDCFIRRL